MKKSRLHWALGFAAVLLTLFYTTRYAMPSLYTPEWAARNVFWPLAAVIYIPVLYGKVRFSVTALAGYMIGLAGGELLGGWEADVGPQYLHHGWWMFLLTFAAACAVGVILQRKAGKRK